MEYSFILLFFVISLCVYVYHKNRYKRQLIKLVVEYFNEHNDFILPAIKDKIRKWLNENLVDIYIIGDNANHLYDIEIKHNEFGILFCYENGQIITYRKEYEPAYEKIIKMFIEHKKMEHELFKKYMDSWDELVIKQKLSK